MEKINAFINGIREFRSDCTTHYINHETALAYDWGREWAHRITLRHFEI